jgi:hypothetical protein
MPPSGPYYAGAATAGVDWANISNATGAPDAAVATNTNEGPGGGGHTPSALVTSTHGFSLPTTAIIDGFLLEAKVSSGFSVDSIIQIGKPGKLSTSTPNIGHFWPGSLSFLSWGGATSLWGRTDWTYSDINSSTFGASLAAYATHATDTINIDAVRITVYWHTAPTSVNKRYIYKISNNGQYIGNLPNVVSDFAVSLDINTAGSQLSVICATSADTSRLSVDPLTDEAGNVLTNESLVTLTTEGQSPIVSPGAFGTNAIIKNGNSIQVIEYSYYWPNGKSMFLGKIERWEASFGGEGNDETIKILAYSDGQDLDNYLIRASPYTLTLDVSQPTQNSSVTVDMASMGGAWDKYGQTWTAGGGVTNLSAISIYMASSVTQTVNMRIYDNPSTLNEIAASGIVINAGFSGEQQFTINPVLITPGQHYFFEIDVLAGGSLTLYAQNTNPYAGGLMYVSNYAGGGGGGAWTPVAGSDLYFKTYSGTGSTIATYTNYEPVFMLQDFLGDYNSRGGKIVLNNYLNTSLALTYTFNTNTIYEGIQAVLRLTPDGYYYTVDLGTNQINFVQTSLTADITITKGRHIDQLVFIATIENVVNQVFFTGGPTSGVNLYKSYANTGSVDLYGPKLKRLSDNRVTVAATADAIGQSAIIEGFDENYQTTVTILDTTMDITLLKPGLLIGFNGFGTFVDQILAQIVRVEYTPAEAKLTLGILPKRLHPEFEKITRGLIAQQTLANPTAPS